MKPLIILGGGLAGLSAAHYSKHPWCLVEMSTRVGGLAKTEVVEGGFSFDATGHWLHLRDQAVRKKVLEEWLPEGMDSFQRRAGILSHGVFTRFPYQINTHGLPAEIVSENVLGFIEAQLGEGGKPLRERSPVNFKEFILRHLGSGFARHFMLPYNQKLWTVDAETLSADWCGRFVPKPSLREVIEGALGHGSDSAGYNANFLYPRSGGIESLVRALHSTLRGEILLETQPVSIDWKSKKVKLSNGQTLEYRGLISSIPLPKLIDCLAKGEQGVPPEVEKAASSLRATTVTYVNVGVSSPNRQPWHWVYLPEPKFKTYRIGSPSAVSPRLSPPGTSSFYVEYSHRGELSKAECEQFAREDLLQAELIHRKEDVLFTHAREISQAYVLYDHAYGPATDTLFKFLKQSKIDVAGRYGKWEYSSMEDAILSGKACAESVDRVR